MHVCVGLYLDDLKKNFEFTKFFLDLERYQEAKNIEKIYLFLHTKTDFEKRLKYKNPIEIFILQTNKLNMSYDLFKEFCFDASLILQCNLLLNNRFKIYDLAKPSANEFEKLFLKDEIDYLDSACYLENKYNKKNDLRDLKIFFFNLNKTQVSPQVYTLTESIFTIAIYNKKKLPKFIKDFFHYNFRIRLNINRTFYGKNLFIILCCGILTKIYIYTFKLVPFYFKGSINNFLKKYFKGIINYVMYFENDRVKKNRGLIQVARYYVNTFTIIIIFRELFKRIFYIR